MTTQNPIEQEDSYPLPETQLDRFLLKVDISYPPPESEVAIMRQVRLEAMGDRQVLEIPAELPLLQKTIFAARQQILGMHMAEPGAIYIAQLVNASRHPQQYSAELGMDRIRCQPKGNHRFRSLRARWSGWMGVTTSRPKMCNSWRRKCSDIAFYSVTRPKSAGLKSMQ
ncbi:MAG: MoxR-like ATPase [Planctomycetota bacterium]|jgi:MoxR-like ATPase